MSERAPSCARRTFRSSRCPTGTGCCRRRRRPCPASARTPCRRRRTRCPRSSDWPPQSSSVAAERRADLRRGDASTVPCTSDRRRIDRRRCRAGRSSRDSSRAREVPSRATVNGRQTWPKPPRGRARAVRRGRGGCRFPGRSASVGLAEKTQLGPLVARAVRVVVAAGAAVGVGRRAAAVAVPSSCRRTSPDRCRRSSHRRRGCTATVHRFRRSPSSGSLSLEALADHAVDVRFAQEPEQAGEADARAARARQLAEAEVVRRAAILRVAVRHADVGRVRRGGDEQRQARLPGAAGRSALHAVRAAGSRGDRSASSRSVAVGSELRVELVEEGRRAGRADRVRAVVVLRAGLHRQAHAFVGGDVGAQAAEIGAAARRRSASSVSSGCRPRAWRRPGRRRRPRRAATSARRTTACRSRCRRAGWPGSRSSAGRCGPFPQQRIARGGVAGEDARLEGGLVDRAARAPRRAQQTSGGQREPRTRARSLDHALDERRVGGVGRELQVLLVVVVRLARAAGAHVALAEELVDWGDFGARRFASSPRAQASPTSPWPSSFSASASTSRAPRAAARAAARASRRPRAPPASAAASAATRAGSGALAPAPARSGGGRRLACASRARLGGGVPRRAASGRGCGRRRRGRRRRAARGFGGRRRRDGPALRRGRGRESVPPAVCARRARARRDRARGRPAEQQRGPREHQDLLALRRCARSCPRWWRSGRRRRARARSLCRSASATGHVPRRRHRRAHAGRQRRARPRYRR